MALSVVAPVNVWWQWKWRWHCRMSLSMQKKMTASSLIRRFWCIHQRVIPLRSFTIAINIVRVKKWHANAAGSLQNEFLATIAAARCKNKFQPTRRPPARYIHASASQATTTHLSGLLLTVYVVPLWFSVNYCVATDKSARQSARRECCNKKCELFEVLMMSGRAFFSSRAKFLDKEGTPIYHAEDMTSEAKEGRRRKAGDPSRQEDDDHILNHHLHPHLHHPRHR